MGSIGIAGPRADVLPRRSRRKVRCAPESEYLVIEKIHRELASVYLVNDVLASNLAMLCAWALRFQFEVIPVTKGQQDLATYGMLLPIITLVFPVAFAVQGLYRIRTARGRAEEAVTVAIGSVFATIIL